MPTRSIGPETYPDLREQVRAICAPFPGEYWRALDRERRYPQEFVDAMTASGLLGALIPREFGGLDLTIAETSVVLEEVHRSGGHAGACHAQLYLMGTLVRHANPGQKDRWLPRLASGDVRLQAFSVTEERAGSETPAIETFARLDGDAYVVDGQKSWTSRVEQSDLLLLLARTDLREAGAKPSAGLTLLLVDLEDAREQGGVEIIPVRTMFNYATYQIRYRDLRVPIENRIGAEGEGLRCALDGMNAERILLASEAIGDGYWFIDQAAQRASQREVFGRPIGMNQGVQFPIARGFASVSAAEQMRNLAASRYDAGERCATEANMAKLLASEAAWQAANACLDTFGGYGFVDEYDVERKFRETRLYQVAPVSNNLVLAYLAHNVLGMPKSY